MAIAPSLHLGLAPVLKFLHNGPLRAGRFSGSTWSTFLPKREDTDETPKLTETVLEESRESGDDLFHGPVILVLRRWGKRIS